MQLRTLLPVIVASLSGCAGSDRSVEGTYALRAVGADSVPLVRPSFIPGEGTTLKGATITLLPGGRLTARVELSITDSGTVELTEDAAGTWERRADSLFVAYRWCATAGCTDSAGASDTGRVASRGLSLHRILRLGPDTFGPDRPLHFERR